MLLNEIEARKILKGAGIKVTDAELAFSRSEAIARSEAIGFPVVLKIVSPDVVHKSDCGGVKLNLMTPGQVGQAYDDIMASVSEALPGASISGVSVQAMADPGTEVIIGVSPDPQFGSIIMFGLGGILVEVLQDVSFRVIPISVHDAAEMIQEIRGFKLLTGFRNSPPVDVPSLSELLVKVSRLVEATPKIKELDLNPVVAYPDGYVAVDARIVLEEAAVPEKKTGARARASLEVLFDPGSIAIIGASKDPNSRGYDFITNLLGYGYGGRIYPINLKESEILGVKAYRRLDDVPGNVDYVIHCIALEHVPALLESGAAKGVKAVHIFSARGSETGREESKALEAGILEQATGCGIRLLGPNCMGVYCPGSGISFSYDFPREKGNVGALVQSGGSSTDIVKLGALYGLRFSKVVSYGNALDINETELLSYMAEDPETSVIIAFVEGLRGDGLGFLRLLAAVCAQKPVIICKGGRSRAGARCALSHTASLAGSSGIWDIAVRQAGGTPVNDIDDLIYMAVGFSRMKPVTGRRVGTGGSGGGRNTVSVDAWEQNGFEVVPLPGEIREKFRRKGALLWDCIDNPADRSIMVPGDPYTVPSLLEEMSAHPDYDFICADIAAEEHPYNKETFVDYVASSIEHYIRLHKNSHKPFFMIFRPRPVGASELDHWFWREVGRMRSRLVEGKVPFFPSVEKAAEVVNAILCYQAHKESRGLV